MQVQLLSTNVDGGTMGARGLTTISEDDKVTGIESPPGNSLLVL